MASGDMNLVLSLTGRDGGARRLLQQTQQELERLNRAQASRRRANRPYEIAGIRVERDIRREIAQTQAAYNRLARSGRASHNDLARAATATRNRIRELNDELGRGAGGWRSRMGAIGRGAATAAAGSAARQSASVRILWRCLERMDVIPSKKCLRTLFIRLVTGSVVM